MLSRCQPDSAWAAWAVSASAANAAKEAITFRIIVPMPANVRRLTRSSAGATRLNRTRDQLLPCPTLPLALAGSGERGRFVDAPDQAREALSEPLPLLLRQKAPNLA